MRTIVAMALLAAALAGCTGSEDGSGISVSGETGSQGPYTFRGPAGADNYTWDMGDQMTRLYGREVTHTYDFHNGVAKVTLKTTDGGVQKTHGPVQVKIGTGQNAQPTMYLDAQTNWTIPGEAVRFSGAASTDPDGDKIRYTWSCFREGDAVRTAPHAHGGTGGIPYGTSAQGKVIPRVAPGPLPEPDRVINGDLCEALEMSTRPTYDATIEGAFAATGKYRITLVAGDAGYTTLGQWSLIVSDPKERPDPLFTASFTGNLTVGVSAAEPAQALFRADNAIDLPLAASGANVTLGLTGPAGAILDGSWQLRKGDVEVASGGVGTTQVTEVLPAGPYTLRVELDQGAGATYSIHVEAPLKMDPFTIY